jgi:hypothetical protein
MVDYIETFGFEMSQRSAAIDEFSKTTPEAIQILSFSNQIHFRMHTPVLPQDLLVQKAMKTILH